MVVHGTIEQNGDWPAILDQVIQWEGPTPEMYEFAVSAPHPIFVFSSEGRGQFKTNSEQYKFRITPTHHEGKYIFVLKRTPKNNHVLKFQEYIKEIHSYEGDTWQQKWESFKLQEKIGKPSPHSSPIAPQTCTQSPGYYPFQPNQNPTAISNSTTAPPTSHPPPNTSFCPIRPSPVPVYPLPYSAPNFSSFSLGKRSMNTNQPNKRQRPDNSSQLHKLSTGIMISADVDGEATGLTTHNGRLAVINRLRGVSHYSLKDLAYYTTTPFTAGDAVGICESGNLLFATLETSHAVAIIDQPHRTRPNIVDTPRLTRDGKTIHTLLQPRGLTTKDFGIYVANKDFVSTVVIACSNSPLTVVPFCDLSRFEGISCSDIVACNDRLFVLDSFAGRLISVKRNQHGVPVPAEIPILSTDGKREILSNPQGICCGDGDFTTLRIADTGNLRILSLGMDFVRNEATVQSIISLKDIKQKPYKLCSSDDANVFYCTSNFHSEKEEEEEVLNMAIAEEIEGNPDFSKEAMDQWLNSLSTTEPSPDPSAQQTFGGPFVNCALELSQLAAQSSLGSKLQTTLIARVKQMHDTLVEKDYIPQWQSIGRRNVVKLLTHVWNKYSSKDANKLPDEYDEGIVITLGSPADRKRGKFKIGRIVSLQGENLVKRGSFGVISWRPAICVGEKTADAVVVGIWGQVLTQVYVEDFDEFDAAGMFVVVDPTEETGIGHVVSYKNLYLHTNKLIVGQCAVSGDSVVRFASDSDIPQELTSSLDEGVQFVSMTLPPLNKETSNQFNSQFIAMCNKTISPVRVTAVPDDDGTMFSICDRYRLSSLAETRRKAQAGDPLYQFISAFLLENFGTLEEDKKEAIDLYSQASKQGYGPASNNLGWIHETGSGVLSSITNAEKFYSAANFDDTCSFNMARCSAVYRDDPMAWYSLGRKFDSGRGIAVDTELAFYCFERAANGGQIPAYRKMGMAYKLGRGTEKNERKAFECFLKAADPHSNNTGDGGDSEAMKELAMAYGNGLGTPVNFQKAEFWLQKAMPIDAFYNRNPPDRKRLLSQSVPQEMRGKFTAVQVQPVQKTPSSFNLASRPLGQETGSGFNAAQVVPVQKTSMSHDLAARPRNQSSAEASSEDTESGCRIS